MTERIDWDQFLGDDSMNESSTEISPEARKLRATFLRCMQARGAQADLARVFRVEQSTISRRLTEEAVDTMCELLARSGMKIVPVGTKVYSPESLNAMLVLATERLEQIKREDLA